MHLIHPDIVSEARGLSVGASAFLLFVGILLWSFGWRWHRFWVVFSLTVFAGVLGMNAGRAAGTQVLVVGVLLALAAGLLALEIAKIMSFVTGGTAAWLAAANLYPGAQELWAIFLCGGLLGVALYRLWTMLASSLIGVLLAGHCIILMLEQPMKYDGVAWLTRNSMAVNGGVIVLSLIGVFAQSWTSRNESSGKSEEKGSDVISIKDLSKMIKKMSPAKAA